MRFAKSIMKGRKARQLIDVDVFTISLVPKGANGFSVLYKGQKTHTLVKTYNAELGELLGVVYAPDTVDSQGDYATADSIKKMAYGFARRGLGTIDINHDNMPLDKKDAYVAESFLVQKGDTRFQGIKTYDGKTVDLTGAWAVVIKINNSQLREVYSQQKWNGISLFGKINASKGDTDMSMTANEIQAMMEKNNESLSKALLGSLATIVSTTVVKSMYPSKLLRKAGVVDADSPEVVRLKVSLYKAKNKPTAEKTETKTQEKTTAKADDKPVFKGDPTDEIDVGIHEYNCKKHQLQKAMNISDVDSIRSTGMALKQLEEDSAEILEKHKTREAQKKLAAASKQPLAIGGNSVAKQMAQYINGTTTKVG